MSCEPPAEPTREEVLAWMATTGLGYRRAARHFGLPVDTVKSWSKLARNRVRAAEVVSLSVARDARARTPQPHPAEDGPPPAPRSLVEDLDDALVLRLRYLAEKGSLAGRDQQSAAVTVSILLDKRTAIEDLDKRRSAQPASAIPGSPEWEAELRESLRSIPRRLIG